MRIIIYLIEDEVEDARKLIEVLNEQAKQRNTKTEKYEFKLLRGTNKRVFNDREYYFYEETIINTIRERFDAENTEDVRIGILLDIMLTEKDVKSMYAHYYPDADIAKKIYFEYSDTMPIYLISAFPGFATQCEVIMGRDLSDTFITKNAILRYNIQLDIDKMFHFFKNNVKAGGAEGV